MPEHCEKRFLTKWGALSMYAAPMNQTELFPNVQIARLCEPDEGGCWEVWHPEPP